MYHMHGHISTIFQEMYQKQTLQTYCRPTCLSVLFPLIYGWSGMWLEFFAASFFSLKSFFLINGQIFRLRVASSNTDRATMMYYIVDANNGCTMHTISSMLHSPVYVIRAYVH
jgi:hypothetical protein